MCIFVFMGQWPTLTIMAVSVGRNMDYGCLLTATTAVWADTHSCRSVVVPFCSAANFII